MKTGVVKMFGNIFFLTLTGECQLHIWGMILCAYPFVHIILDSEIIMCFAVDYRVAIHMFMCLLMGGLRSVY